MSEADDVVLPPTVELGAEHPELRDSVRAHCARDPGSDCFRAGDVAMQTHCDFSFTKDYEVERKWRESRLYPIAPISANTVLAYVGQHVLGMERSY